MEWMWKEAISVHSYQSMLEGLKKTTRHFENLASETEKQIRKLQITKE
jgi:hypothetical protein